MAMTMCTCWLLILLLLLETRGATSTDPPGARNKDSVNAEAYATLLYDDSTPYYLATRVLGQFLKETNTERAMVVLCTEDVGEEAKNILRGDGWIVKDVHSVKNPYYGVPKKFDQVFTKLRVWTLVEYRRVVYLDSDVLIYSNVDELFRCGTFCAAYRHSDVFNSGVFVLKPDYDVYQDMMKNVGNYNYITPDQGFLNAYFRDLLYAPLFNSSSLDYHEGIMRLSNGYNADSGQYYINPKGFFPISEYKILHHTLAFLKPWTWYSYPMCDLNWKWQKVRDRLHPSPDSATVLLLPGALLVVIIAGLYLFRSSALYTSGFITPDGYVIDVMVHFLFPLASLVSFCLVPADTHWCYAVPAFTLWMGVLVSLFYSLLYVLIRKPSTLNRASTLQGINQLFCVIGFLVLVVGTFLIPLHVSDSVWTRFLTYLALIGFAEVFSYFIGMHLIQTWVA